MSGSKEKPLWVKLALTYSAHSHPRLKISAVMEEIASWIKSKNYRHATTVLINFEEEIKKARSGQGKSFLASERPVDRLFEDRVPEAAAKQLAVVLVWATECELATIERLELLKSTSKSELRRHRSIANTLIHHCYDLKVEPYGLRGTNCTRVQEKLEELKKILSVDKFPIDTEKHLHYLFPDKKDG